MSDPSSVFWSGVGGAGPSPQGGGGSSTFWSGIPTGTGVSTDNQSSLLGSAGQQPSGNAAPAPKKGGGGFFGSLLQNLKAVPNLVEAAGTFLPHVAVGAGENIVNDVTAIPHAVGLTDYKGTSLGGSAESPYTGTVSTIPFQQTAQSIGQTVGDIAHPSRLGQDWQSGNFFPALSRDVANAALVAAPLAKGLSVGATAAAYGTEEGLAAAQSAAADTAAAGGDLTARQAAADTAARTAAPPSFLSRAAAVASPVERGLAVGANAPQSVLQAGGRLAFQGGLGLLGKVAPEAASGVSDFVAQQADRMAMRRAITDVNAQSMAPQRRIGPLLSQQLKLGLSPEEEAASTLTRQGEAGALAPLTGMSPETLGRVAEENFPQTGTKAPVTGGALNIALHPELQSPEFQRYTDLGRQINAPRTANFEAAARSQGTPGEVQRQFGFTQKPSEEQLGTQPLSNALEAGMEPRAPGAAPAYARPPLLAARGAAGTLEGLAQEAQHAGLQSVADTLREHGAQLPTELQQLNEQGVLANAEHLKGGVAPQGKAPYLGPSRTGQQLPSVRKLSSERQRTTGQIGRSAVEQAQRVSEDERQAAINRGAQMIADKFGTKGSSIAEGATGTELAAAARQAKLTAWDPRSPFGTVPDKQLGPDTTFIPAHLFSEFKGHFGGAPTNRGLALFDTLTREFRTIPKIALNPAFHVAHIVGHAVQDVLGEGLHTLQPGNIKAAAEGLKTGAVPEEALGGRGGGTLGTNELRGLPGTTHAGGKAINASYHLMQRTSDLSHAIVYQAARARGLSDDAAKVQALRVAGDFGNMSNFESGVLRRVMPAYGFARHITKLALTLPVTNPVRTAWFLHLGDMFGTPQGALPSTAKGDVKLPGSNSYVPLGFLTNPFGYAMGLMGNPSGDIASGLNPVLKLGLAGMFGDKATTTSGIAPMSHPGSQTGPHALFAPTNLHELPYVLAQESPQGKLIQALLSGGPPVKRYDTGEVKKGRTAGPAPYNAPPALLRSLLGIPQPETVTNSKGQRVP